MIATGVDIVEIKRIKKFVDENIANLDRIFSSIEIDYCNSKKNKYESFAVRFSAKEAVIKALDDKTIELKNIEVKNSETGKPQVVIKDERYSQINEKISVSLSHTKNYAIAFVVIS
jgi:holo-[acyl-carrier protein] synthase